LKEFNTNLTTFDIEDLSDGLYFVKMYSDKGKLTKKLVKK